MTAWRSRVRRISVKAGGCQAVLSEAPYFCENVGRTDSAAACHDTHFAIGSRDGVVRLVPGQWQSVYRRKDKLTLLIYYAVAAVDPYAGKPLIVEGGLTCKGWLQNVSGLPIYDAPFRTNANSSKPELIKPLRPIELERNDRSAMFVGEGIL